MTRTSDLARLDAENLKRNPYNTMGKAWRLIPFAAGSALAKMFAVNNILAIAGAGVQLFTTTDGYTFTSRTVSTWSSLVIQGLAYGAAKYLAVTDGGTAGARLATSNDLATWTLSSGVGGTGQWLGAAYGNGLFLIIGAQAGDTRVMTSTDGLAWTARSDPTNLTNLTHVVFGGGKFVVLGTGGTQRAAITADGVNWSSPVGLPNTNTYGGVAFGDNRWVAVTTGTTGKAYYSTDGVNWTESNMPARNWSGVTYGNGVFVAWSNTTTGTEAVATSIDGITWRLQDTAVQNIQGGSYFNGTHWLTTDSTSANARVLRAVA